MMKNFTLSRASILFLSLTTFVFSHTSTAQHLETPWHFSNDGYGKCAALGDTGRSANWQKDHLEVLALVRSKEA